MQNLAIAVLNTGLYLAIYFLSKGALGFGDVRLSFLLGLYFGYAQLKAPELIEANFYSWGSASIYVALTLIFKGSVPKISIPFAPFLFIGPAITLLDAKM